MSIFISLKRLFVAFLINTELPNEIRFIKSSKAICRGVKNFSWKKTAMKSLGVLSTDSAPFTSPFQYR